METQESSKPKPAPAAKRSYRATAKRAIPSAGDGEIDGPHNEKAAFEFCEVCKLNHDQGRRHKYFPSHTRALAALLDRLRKRFADVRYFLRNPSPLDPERAARNSLWCTFCSVDVRELDNPFTCENAIYHLASAGHRERLEEFLRKHGGGMDRLDGFRITETDLHKWEKACKTLKITTPSSCERPLEPLRRTPKYIQHDYISITIDKFEKDSSFISNVSPSVIPLQSLTNEEHREYRPEFSGHMVSGSIPCDFTSLLQGTFEFHGMGVQDALSEHSTVSSNGQKTCHSSSGKGLNRSIHSGGNCNSAWEDFHQISWPPEVCQSNRHIDAAPPWVELSEEANRGMHTGNLSSEFPKPKKLNPKRVGAAWAEKRKAQLEREKNGEIIVKDADSDWLPKFGRVWQVGTRKESRKEFEIEKRKLLKSSSQSNQSFGIQPYISKRMRVGSAEVGSVSGHFEENIGSL